MTLASTRRFSWRFLATKRQGVEAAAAPWNNCSDGYPGSSVDTEACMRNDGDSLRDGDQLEEDGQEPPLASTQITGFRSVSERTKIDGSLDGRIMELVLDSTRKLPESAAEIPMHEWEAIKTKLCASHAVASSSGVGIRSRVTWLLDVLQRPEHDQHPLMQRTATLYEQVTEYDRFVRLGAKSQRRDGLRTRREARHNTTTDAPAVGEAQGGVEQERPARVEAPSTHGQPASTARKSKSKKDESLMLLILKRGSVLVGPGADMDEWDKIADARGCFTTGKDVLKHVTRLLAISKDPTHELHHSPNLTMSVVLLLLFPF